MWYATMDIKKYFCKKFIQFFKIESKLAAWSLFVFIVGGWIGVTISMDVFYFPFRNQRIEIINDSVQRVKQDVVPLIGNDQFDQEKVRHEIERVLTNCESYFDFALEEPSTFRILFYIFPLAFILWCLSIIITIYTKTKQKYHSDTVSS